MPKYRLVKGVFHNYYLFLAVFNKIIVENGFKING